MRTLLIEDDPATAKLVGMALAEDGLAVDHTRSGSEGRTLALVNDYDAILLDLMLPDLQGLQVILELRRAGRTVPILVMTSDDDESVMVHALDAGADDFVVKPASQRELRARVRALVRRGGAKRLEVIQMGSLVLNRMTREVLHHGRRLDFTNKEFNLIEHFLLNANAVVSRSDLLEKVWDMHFDPGSNVLDVHVGRLRRKLAGLDGAPRLVTLRGAGYRLVPPDAPDAPDAADATPGS